MQGSPVRSLIAAALLGIIIISGPSVAAAQQVPAPSTGAARSHLTLSVGTARAHGGGIDEDDAYTAQIAWSAQVGRSRGVSWRAGASGGSVFANGSDLVSEPLPSIYFVSALAGIELAESPLSFALHLGPTWYGAGSAHGASSPQNSSSGFGAESRLDLGVHLVGRVGISVQGRYLVLPQLNEGTLKVRSIALGLRFGW